MPSSTFVQTPALSLPLELWLIVLQYLNPSSRLKLHDPLNDYRRRRSTSTPLLPVAATCSHLYRLLIPVVWHDVVLNTQADLNCLLASARHGLTRLSTAAPADWIRILTVAVLTNDTIIELFRLIPRMINLRTIFYPSWYRGDDYVISQPFHEASNALRLPTSLTTLALTSDTCFVSLGTLSKLSLLCPHLTVLRVANLSSDEPPSDVEWSFPNLTDLHLGSVSPYRPWGSVDAVPFASLIWALASTDTCPSLRRLDFYDDFPYLDQLLHRNQAHLTTLGCHPSHSDVFQNGFDLHNAPQLHTVIFYVDGFPPTLPYHNDSLHTIYLVIVPPSAWHPTFSISQALLTFFFILSTLQLRQLRHIYILDPSQQLPRDWRPPNYVTRREDMECRVISLGMSRTYRCYRLLIHAWESR